MKHVPVSALRGSVAIIRKGDDEDPASIVTKALGDFTSDFEKKFGDRMKALEEKGADPKLIERLDNIEKKMNRPNGEGGDDEDAKAHRAAWLNYLRKGVQTPDVELKVLTVASDVQAGYLAPPEVSKEFIDEVTELSPIRQYATVRTSQAPSVRYPKRTSGTNAKWEGEIEESEESNLTYGQIEIESKRLTTFVDVSNSLIMGSDPDAEAEVRRAFAEDFAEKEAKAFVSGDGIKEPQGILTAPEIPFFANGHATVVNTDSLIGLMYSMPSQYRNRGVWIMNATSIATIRKMKDGQGNYLWQPSFQAGAPETILGRPIVEAIDWPDIASGAFPIAFGDLKTAYRIIDRQRLATLSDPYTQARRAITRVHGTQWVGGGVVQPNALKKLKMSLS